MRTIRCELTTDTSYFTPLQLQPRVLLSLAFNGLSQWLNQHLVSFPQLITEHRASVVILAVDLEYEKPLRFFDAPTLSMTAGLSVLRAGSRAQLEVTFEGKAGTAARVRVVLCPVEVLDPVSLGANPGPFPPGILKRFLADEVGEGSPVRNVPPLISRVESSSKALATHRSEFSVSRHLCEVADQWAFFEVPGLVGTSREEMAMASSPEAHPLVRSTLAKPLRSFRMELSRPYFWFQPGSVATAAHQQGDSMVFIHRLLSPVPGGELHGIAVEEF